LQGRFEEKWNQTVVPKLAEEESMCRGDEAAARARLDEAGHRQAAEALRGEAERLRGHFAALENRIMEAKSMAAAACLPMSTAAKVPRAKGVVGMAPEMGCIDRTCSEDVM
jgi:hypothetical protein